MRRLAAVFLVLAVLLGSAVTPAAAQDAQAQVQAILFYSPTCSHCHKVITQDLPPLYEAYGGADSARTYTSLPADEAELEIENNYGPALVLIQTDQLEILYVNVAWPIGQDLYTQASGMYDVPDGVPRLVVGDFALVGDVEIPGQLPGIIENGLQAGGIGWPAFTGLEEALASLTLMGNPDAAAETPTSEEEQTAPSEEVIESPEASDTPPQQPTAAPTEDAFSAFDASNLTVMERIQRDLAGNLLAIAVLLAMIAAMVYAALNFKGKSVNAEAAWKRWIIPALSVVGMGVAGYLAFIETSGVEAVCGPIGDCNTVNQSKYAILFGVLPVAIFGLLGYLGILAAWLVNILSKGRAADASRVAVFAFAVLGTLFSIYLTFLEPFVIGATCAWCLSSAVIITLLMLISLQPAKASWNRLQKSRV